MHPRTCLWLGLGGPYLTKFATGKVHYNFGLINFARKWLTMAPEAQGALVLPDPPPLKWSFPTTFVFIKVLPRLTVKAVDALQTLFRVPWPWWSGYRVKTMLRTFSRCSVNCLITIWSTYHLIEWDNWLTVQWMDIWSNPNWPKVIWLTVL